MWYHCDTWGSLAARHQPGGRSLAKMHPEKVMIICKLAGFLCCYNKVSFWTHLQLYTVYWDWKAMLTPSIIVYHCLSFWLHCKSFRLFRVKPGGMCWKVLSSTSFFSMESSRKMREGAPIIRGVNRCREMLRSHWKMATLTMWTTLTELNTAGCVEAQAATSALQRIQGRKKATDRCLIKQPKHFDPTGVGTRMPLPRSTLWSLKCYGFQ